MAILSMVCGIIGLCGIFYILISYFIIISFEENVFLTLISITLILLALILGIIGRSKSKNRNYYNMATSGFIMGLVGIASIVLPVIVVNRLPNNKFYPYPESYPIQNSSYSIFTSIGLVTTKTKDIDSNFVVIVEMFLGYSNGDKIIEEELKTKTYVIRDFIKNYFSEKYISELMPEYEVYLKKEILELLNTRLLNSGTVKIILFSQLDIKEMQ